MNTPKTGSWVAGTAVVSLLILVATWFLAISPVLAAAAETQAQAVSELEQNELTRTKIIELQRQFDQLDALKAEVAALQVQIPTTYDLASYQRELATIATAHSVTLTSVQASPAVVVVPVVSAEAAAAAAAAAVTAASATSETTTEAAAPVTAAAANPLYSMAVSLNVIGTYANVLAFLQDLQTGTQRLYLVEGLAGNSLEQADATASTPATNPGDLELVINGSLYVLPELATAAAVVPADPAAAAPVLPIPDAAKNPLVPLS